MGNTNVLPIPSLQNNYYMALTIGSYNDLFLLHAGQKELDAVRNAIKSNYPEGIEKERYDFEEDKNNPKNKTCYKFTLNGRIFIARRENLLASSLIIAAVFKALEELGWKVIITSQLTQNNEQGTCIFQRQLSNINISPIFSVALLHFDILQLNNCPEELIDVVKGIIQNRWPKGIQKEERFEQAYWIKLKGNPWNDFSKKSSIAVRGLIKDILERFSSMHYQYYVNCNLVGGVDAMFFKTNMYIEGEKAGNYLSISLNEFDRIRLTDMPDYICTAIKETVESYWKKGIKQHSNDSDCYELKLSGRPWCAFEEEGSASRYLICRIMETMARFGYFIIAGLDVALNDADKSLLLFKQGAPLNTSFMCVSMTWISEIKFINAPVDVTEAGIAILRNSPHGVSSEKPATDIVSYEADLKNVGWRFADVYGMHGRHLLLCLLSQFQSMGWRLVCSADVSAMTSDGEPRDAHSWWFMHDLTLIQ